MFVELFTSSDRLRPAGQPNSSLMCAGAPEGKGPGTAVNVMLYMASGGEVPAIVVLMLTEPICVPVR